MPRGARFLIVGQGIAGSMLAYALMRRGRGRGRGEDFLLVDAGLEYSSSLVSVGVLNPIVFKRMTLSWGSDLLPVAWEVYAELEGVLGGGFLHRTELLHLLRDGAERRRWNEARAVPRLEPWLGEVCPVGGVGEVDGVGGRYGGLVRGSGWVETDVLLRSFRKYLLKQGRLVEEKFEAGRLQDGVWQSRQGDISFQTLILCTGIQYRYSSEYALPDYTLPFYPVKGDVLTLSLPGLRPAGVGGHANDRIIGDKVIVQPLFNAGGVVEGLFRCGSSYLRDFSDARPSAEGRRWILSELSSMGIEVDDAQVRGHSAGIRPASRDRLAYLGNLGNLAGQGGGSVIVFNGLGTRGFMLAPGLAERLADFLLEGRPLPARLSPARLG